MEQDTSNPNDQLPANNKAANDQVFGSSSEFFEQLEREVNGGVDDSLVESAGQQTPEARNEPLSQMRAQRWQPLKIYRAIVTLSIGKKDTKIQAGKLKNFRPKLNS